MTKEELKNYSRMNIELARLEEKIAVLRNRVESPRGAVLTNTGKGGERKDFTDYIDKLIELQEHYSERAKIIFAEQIKIEMAIAAIDDPVSRLILGYRYIDGLDWQAISEKIHYSQVHTVYRLHPKALNELQEKHDVK